MLELETDKAQIDVEAPEDGILAKILVSNKRRMDRRLGAQLGLFSFSLAMDKKELSTH